MLTLMSLTWSVCSLSTTSSVDLLSHCLPVCSREVNRRHEPHHDCMWAESVKLSPPFLNKVVKHKRTGLKSQQSAGWIWLAEDSWCQQNVPYAKIVNVRFDHMTFALWVMKLERKHLKEFRLIIGVDIQHFSNYRYLYFLCPTVDKRIYFKNALLQL